MIDQTDERRKSPRQKAFLSGKLYFNNRLNVVDCIIRDISERGARLIFSEAVTPPDDLELYIPQKDQTLNVRIIWRRGEQAGVCFHEIAKVDRPLEPSEIVERFATLEAEIAGLKRIIKKIKIKEGPETEVA